MASIWQKMKIGDFITLEYGKPLDKSKRKDDGIYPAYGANGIKCRSDEFYFDKETIIVGRKGSAGEITLTEERFWPLDVTYFVKFDDDKYDLMFIYYLLSRLNLPNLATGVKPGINRNNVYAIEVSVPDITEQKRIVALLNTMFSDLEQVHVKTEQNLKNAAELFDSYLQQVFSQKGEEWVEDKLKSVCRLINGRAYKKPEMLAEGKYPLLRVGNFFTNRSWYYSDLELPEDKYCNNGDLLYAWSASFGPRIWKGGKTIYHYHIWKTDINNELILKDFLFYWFHWDATNVKKEHGAGSTMIHVSMTSMNARNISYPSIKKQKNIVDKLQSLESRCKELEVIYKDKLNLIDELKKSILQKAFSGELTTSAK
jgi:type I restriction enzyme S subunit